MYSIRELSDINLRDYFNCLNHLVFDNNNSKGRRYNLDEDMDYFCINPFSLDFAKIMQSKSLRRLEGKTQVFQPNFNIYVRNRLKHTLEVIANSAIISDLLGLNTELCKAISAGHDIGHTPFGHVVEKYLGKKIAPLKFRHEVNSVVLAQHVERKGQGLNLTYETLEGMLNHSRGNNELSINSRLPQEYAVVMLADKFSYIFSDYNDSQIHRMNHITSDCEFNELISLNNSLGSNQRERVNICIKALILESNDSGIVSFSKGEIFDSFNKIKNEMYNKVYERINSKTLIFQADQIYSIIDDSSLNELKNACFLTNNVIPKGDIKPHPALIMSLLTDIEIERLITYSLNHRSLSINDIIKETSLSEIIPNLFNKNFEPFSPDLDWVIS